jgi:hypothetical protein
VSSAGTRVIHLLMAWLVYCAILIIQQPLDKAGWSYRAHRPQGNPPAGSGDLGGQRIERADLMSQAGRQLAQGRDGIRPLSSSAPWLPRWGQPRLPTARGAFHPSRPFANNGRTFCGSVSGQLGDDRSERISGVGADNKVGEAALLPSSQDFLDGRRRVTWKYQ